MNATEAYWNAIESNNNVQSDQFFDIDELDKLNAARIDEELRTMARRSLIDGNKAAIIEVHCGIAVVADFDGTFED